MKLLFTTTDLFLSRLIRWAFNESCSHFAICFDSKFVVHSSLFGVELRWYDEFKDHSIIVFEKELVLSLEQQEAFYQAMIKVAEKEYDYKAFLYFAYRAFLFKFFNKSMPIKNPWDNQKEYLCTEIAKFLPFKGLKNIDFSIITPEQLLNKLKETNFELE